MTEFFTELSVWHWFAFALILFGIEMMTGTFDLLMIAIAAFCTGVFAHFAPAGLGGWESQLIVFGIVSVGLIVLGRTIFAGMRKVVDEHPTLNKRMNSLIGKRGMVTSDFEAGQGRVKSATPNGLLRALTDLICRMARQLLSKKPNQRLCAYGRLKRRLLLRLDGRGHRRARCPHCHHGLSPSSR